MKFARIAMPLAILSFVALPAHAEDAATKNKNFIEKAAIGGMFEVESSKIALTRSTNPEVKTFAQEMVTDHTKAGEALKEAVKASGVTVAVPPILDEEHQKKVTALKEADAKDFDEDYIEAQEDGHDKTIALFEDYAKDGENAVLKKFAADTLPTLKTHKEHVDTLDKAIN